MREHRERMITVRAARGHAPLHPALVGADHYTRLAAPVDLADRVRRLRMTLNLEEPMQPGEPATYVGPTIRAPFSGGRFLLIHGQRVLVQESSGPDTWGVRYDPADPQHNACEWSYLTTINGVPTDHLEVHDVT